MTPDIAPTPEAWIEEILEEVDRMPVRRMEAILDEPGRNDPCPCGSGRKYKKCYGSPA